MIKKCKMELRKRFPTPALLRAFLFVDPRYYLSEEASLADFQSKLHLLASHYKPGEPGPCFDQNSCVRKALVYFSWQVPSLAN
jgi:hypothetical protein